MRKPYPWPLGQMIDMYTSGMTADKVADVLSGPDWQPHWLEHLGREYFPKGKTVNTLLRESGCPMRKAGVGCQNRPEPYRFPLPEMIEMAKSGMTHGQIADVLSGPDWQPHWLEHLGREYTPRTTAVTRAFRRAGNPVPRRGIPYPIGQMIDMYTSGMTVDEVAEVLCSPQWESYWLEHWGRKYRPGGKIVNKVLKESGCRMRKNGVSFPEKHGSWNGGRVVDKTGYILLHRPDHPCANKSGYVREHRLVMEQHLGRHLLAEEVVHHIDDDRANNSIDNLMLFPNNAAHLAATLKGKCPNWTPEGRRRIAAAHRKNPPGSEHGVREYT